MSFVYSSAANLIGKRKVGSTECVALIQTFTRAPHTSMWVAGEPVLGNRDIKPGTAIATFRNGRYYSRPHGNHAAFFLRQEHNGIVVVDQWHDRPNQKPRNIEKRTIHAWRLPPNKDGSWPHESDNADAYYVIETRQPK